jgi:hypothetical protein
LQHQLKKYNIKIARISGASAGIVRFNDLKIMHILKSMIRCMGCYVPSFECSNELLDGNLL